MFVVDRHVPMTDIDPRIAVLETRNADVIVVVLLPLLHAYYDDSYYPQSP